MKKPGNVQLYLDFPLEEKNNEMFIYVNEWDPKKKMFVKVKLLKTEFYGRYKLEGSN